MKMILLATALISLAAGAEARASNASCELAQKELNLIKSEKEMMIAKYKLAVKENVRNQLKAGAGAPGNTGGRKITLNVNPNSDAVKAISKLGLAEATFEATLEMCKDGELKPEVSNNLDGYKAQLIPMPDELAKPEAAGPKPGATPAPDAATPK